MPYPSKDSEFELTMQIVRPLAVPYLLSLAAVFAGFRNDAFARVWFGALTLGPLVCFSFDVHIYLNSGSIFILLY